MEGKRTHYLAIVIKGIVALIFAMLAFFATGLTLEVLLLLVGIYFFVSGLFAVIGALMATDHRYWWMLLLEGIISMVIGMIVIVWPGISITAMIYLVAIWAILSGVFEVIAGLVAAWAAPAGAFVSIAGVFTLLLGILFIVYPVATVNIIIWMLGIYALFTGLAYIIFGIRLKLAQ